MNKTGPRTCKIEVLKNSNGNNSNGPGTHPPKIDPFYMKIFTLVYIFSNPKAQIGKRNAV